MLERRGKQALQSALPSGFWGMPPPAPPQTDELEPWQIMQPSQPQSGDAPPSAGDLEPWQILQRPQPQQPESMWNTYAYSAGPPPPPPPQGSLAIGVRRPLLPAQCLVVWHPQRHQDQQPQQHLQQQPRQPQHRNVVKRWLCSTPLLGKCDSSWLRVSNLYKICLCHHPARQ